MVVVFRAVQHLAAYPFRTGFKAYPEKIKIRLLEGLKQALVVLDLCIQRQVGTESERFFKAPVELCHLGQQFIGIVEAGSQCFYFKKDCLNIWITFYKLSYLFNDIIRGAETDILAFCNPGKRMV